MARTLAIGDVHGCLTALDTLLGQVRPAAGDTLVFLGDYVDRGPDSKGVIERILSLQRELQMVCLRGNHEIMMAYARKGRDDLRFWCNFGGVETLQSYATPLAGPSLAAVPDQHWQFLERGLRDSFETATHIFVHANLHPELPLDQQQSEWLHWQALSASWHRRHQSGKTMICGHTQQRTGVPLALDNTICIDTWVYGDGWLTCLDVDTNEYWQANEFGQFRSDLLPRGSNETRPGA